MPRVTTHNSVLAGLAILALATPSCVQKNTKSGVVLKPDHINFSEDTNADILASPIETQSEASIEPTSEARGQETIQQLAIAIRDEQLDPEHRLDAAQKFLDLAPAQTIEPMLKDVTIRPLMLQAVNGVSNRACAILEASSDANLGQDELIALINTAAGARNQRAAACLIAQTANPGLVANHAMRALHRMTGLNRAGDPGQWQSWWTEASRLSPESWNSVLITQYADRIDRMEVRLSAQDRMIVDLHRRLYFLGDQAARVQLLAEMLASEHRSVQNLAFELADRELSENITLGPVVEDAATSLLTHPEPEIRAASARLINRLAPTRSAAPMVAALHAETSPIAAEALLLAVSRWPEASQIPIVLRWLREPRTVAPAAQAGVALFDAGHIVSDEHREAFRAQLVPLPQEPSAARLQLLSLIGTDSDRMLIAELLGSPSERIRLAAIDALARTAESATILVERVEQDPSHLSACLIALARYNQLSLVADRFDSIEPWAQAFTVATSSSTKTLLAQQILRRFAPALSEEDLTLYRASAEPGG